ncbi:MAG: hypothetical protein II101_07665, partial [Ruminococcus sp.]|nr:hypothetical protein [Ruminococcus sp.]
MKKAIHVEKAATGIHRYMETSACEGTILGQKHGFAPAVHRIMRFIRNMFPFCQLRITKSEFFCN